jgi:competence protein ComEC
VTGSPHARNSPPPPVRAPLSRSSRRAFGCALAGAAGVAAARAGASATALLAIAFFLLPGIACLVSVPRRRGTRGGARAAAWGIAVCALGAFDGAVERWRDPAPPLLAAWSKRGFEAQRSPVRLRGVVVDLERPDPDRAVLVVRSIGPAAGPNEEGGPDGEESRGFLLPAGLGVRLTVPVAEGEPIPWSIGEVLGTTARVGVPHSFRNPGAFDYAASLKSRGVDLTGSIKSPRLVERGGREPAWRLPGPRLRRRLVVALEELSQDRRPTADFLLALLLGERQSLAPDLEDRLKRAGVFHILALSGFNVALVAGGAGWALRLVLRHPGARRGAVLGVVLLYAVVARPGGSILRAALMVGLLLLARHCGRAMSAAGALAASAALLLAARPAWLFDPGFQLSYAATLGLLFGAGPVGAPGAGTGTGPPGGAASAAGRALRWTGRQGLASIRVSAAALLATAPLTARHFQSVTLAGLVANLAAVPLAAACLFLAVAAAPLALVWPRGAGLVLALATPLAGLLDTSASWAARIPGGSFFVQPPSWGMAALLGLLTGGSALMPRGAARRTLACAALATALLLAARGRQPRPPERLDVVVFDVGQGDAILVRSPRGPAMLVDAGGLPRGEFDPGARVVAPALRALGILRLDLLVVTHPHRDHLGGAPAIVRLFRPRAVWIGASGFEDPRLAPLVAAAEETGARLLLPRRGVTEPFGGVRIEVLNPAPGRSGAVRGGPSGNDESIVLRLRFGRRSLLLTGDMERPAEAGLLSEGRPVAAEILKVAHHGSDTSTSAPFLEAVGPRAAVVSAGLLNPWGHPSPAVMRRLADQGVRVFRTDRDGAILARTDGLVPWRLQPLTSGPDEQSGGDVQAGGDEGQHEQREAEDRDGEAPGTQGLDRLEGARVSQRQDGDQEPDDDEVIRPRDQPPGHQEGRAEARHQSVGARGDGVEHVSAVELPDGQEIQRGREQPEPGRDEQGMQVNRGSLRRVEEEGGEHREQQAGRKEDLPRRGGGVGGSRQRETEQQDRHEGDEPGNRARHPDVEQGAPGRKRGTDADDGPESAEHVRPGKEVGKRGLDPIEPAGHIVPHLVTSQDEQGRQRIRQPRPPLQRLQQQMGQTAAGDRLVGREQGADEGGGQKRCQEEPGMDPHGRSPPRRKSGDRESLCPRLRGDREGDVAQRELPEVAEVLPGLEPDRLSRRDADFRPGPGIPADPFLARLHLEHPKAAQLDPLPAPHRFLHGVEDRLHRHHRPDAGDLGRPRHIINNVAFDHALDPTHPQRPARLGGV